MRLEVCGSTDPPGMDLDQVHDLHLAVAQGQAGAGLLPELPHPPVLHIEAGGALAHCRHLRELCLTALHGMDLVQLPPTVTMLMIQVWWGVALLCN